MTKSLAAPESIDPERLLMEMGSFNQQSDIDARMEGILSDALSVVRNELGMNVGFVSRFSAGRRFIIAVDSSDAEPVLKVGDSDPLENSYCQRVVGGRFPRLISDALKFPPARKLPVTEALPVRAHASSRFVYRMDQSTVPFVASAQRLARSLRKTISRCCRCSPSSRGSRLKGPRVNIKPPLSSRTKYDPLLIMVICILFISQFLTFVINGSPGTSH